MERCPLLLAWYLLGRTAMAFKPASRPSGRRTRLTCVAQLAQIGCVCTAAASQ